MDTESSRSVREYYADPHVRRRIRQYCGDDGDGGLTCAFVSAMTGREPPPVVWDFARRFPVSELDELVDAGAAIARSTWDTASLLIHLDVDYLNVDFPG